MKIIKGLRQAVFAVPAMLLLMSADALAVTLKDIKFSTMAGDITEIALEFDGAPPEVSGYTIEKPARIAIDLPGVQSALQTKRHEIGNGNARSATIVATKDRARLVVNLTQLAAYTTTANGNTLLVRIGERSEEKVFAGNTVTSASGASVSPASDMKVVNVDFRRGELGEGQIQIMLNDARASANIRREGSKIIADLSGVRLPDVLSRRLDVTDFATPVKYVDARREDGVTRIVIEPTSDNFEYLAYQTDKLLSINVSEPPKDQKEAQKKQFPFTGEKLSLNFQNIEVRAVLQLIADFTGLNLVASDSVQGAITLRLQNVPWDQALDLVLKTKGLGQRQMGSVLLIAPAAEIAAREKVELEAVRQVEELAPLVTEYMQLKYAKASVLATLLTSEQGLLSERGTAVVDERTNTLLMKDTSANLEKVREAIIMLDVPVRQVLIEARIVVANTSVGKELGVKWGGASFKDNGSNWTTAGGSQQTLTEGSQILFDRATTGSSTQKIDLTNANIVDFGATNAAASTFAIGYQTADFLLDLELSAIETEGRAEIVSQPRVITADGQTASIESGTEIPYQQASSSGATNVAFKSAVLRLEVTPQITPDDRIIMDLLINQDSVGEQTSAGPSINTNAVETQVLVENGETVVLGGIFRSEDVTTIRKTPFFGDLPLIGALFRYKSKTDTKSELLVFITPRLVKDTLSTR
ncbi:MAG: type IV pilus secretin PilQ [Thalassobium sp.]|jgi:type IV pilus assembly protein PilQ|uniref:type IV pilus secretin PilQ n=1 Tax=Thalassolituus oleivorans TaxID=187493 RepID=UPI0009494A31|nr:type IV pilus secretin PilQ [Thalassolituus oleivorans]APR68343.1 fimbrial protein [Thalassolituus oleivorans]MBQ0726577.1 type IV pilus secretin PilQ [Thalassolituus oleivorans]MBQ0782519.1 type IV pilus secretin PilQ [Thalassolituus oleivorans]PHQ87856.1 MAG: type IV pilus secretin PilQ [Thalassobium sp.]